MNLTEERLRKLNRVDVGALPLDMAIKKVKGNGARKMYVFSDADCPFCAKLEQELKNVDNVTIYTFLFPIDQLHPDAARKSRMIWCAPDRVKAWDAFYESGALPDNAGDCDNPIAKTVELGAALQGQRHADAGVRRRLASSRARCRRSGSRRSCSNADAEAKKLAAARRSSRQRRRHRRTRIRDGHHRFPQEAVHRHHRVDGRLARHAVVPLPRRGQGDQERRAAHRARVAGARSSSTWASSATRSARASTR